MGVNSGQAAYMDAKNTLLYPAKKWKLEKKTLFLVYNLRILQNQFKIRKKC